APAATTPPSPSVCSTPHRGPSVSLSMGSSAGAESSTMPRPIRSTKRFTAVSRARDGVSPPVRRLCRKSTSDTPIRNWKTGAGKSKARRTSPSLCWSTSGTRRRKTFIMLANSMPSTASARQASRKAIRRAPAPSVISVHLRDAVEYARLDSPVELVLAAEAVQQVPEHGELGAVLVERRLLGGQLRRGQVDPAPERVRGLLDGRRREPVAVAPRARPGVMVDEVGEHEEALGQHVRGLEGIQRVDHEVARVRVVEVDVVGVRDHDHVRAEAEQLAGHERGEILAVVLGAVGRGRAVLLGVGRGEGAGARPVVLPELRQSAVGKAEEDEVAAVEPQVAGRGDGLPPPHLPELDVVGVTRLLLVEVLLDGLLVAV